MPIYEFFCPDCNTIFNFYSSRVNTDRRPDCPACGRPRLERRMSVFAVTGRAEEPAEPGLDGLDESRVESAFAELMRESETLSEDDPRQMAALMRRFSERTGVGLGEEMEKALSRLEAGEDPDVVEKDMEELGEDAFTLEAMKRRVRRAPPQPRHDERLYEL